MTQVFLFSTEMFMEYPIRDRNIIDSSSSSKSLIYVTFRHKMSLSDIVIR